MFNKEATPARRNAWLAVSMCAPLVQVAGGCNWLTVLVTGAVSLVLAAVVLGIGIQITGRWLLWAELAWLSVVAAEIASWTTAYWPQYQTFPVVPLTLVVLAFVASGEGTERASRAGTVLFWFLLLLNAVVLLAGAKEVELKWLMPERISLKPRLALVLLLPFLMVYHGEGNKGAWKSLGPILLFGLAVSAVAFGVLSPGIAEESVSAFYETSRSLSLLGFVERFESVVAAALTLGYFCTLSYLISTAAKIAGTIKQGWEKRGAMLCTAAAAGLLVSGVGLLPEVLLIGSVVLWVLPSLISTVFERKRQEKAGKTP